MSKSSVGVLIEPFHQARMEPGDNLQKFRLVEDRIV